jgi:hypothetical protein
MAEVLSGGVSERTATATGIAEEARQLLRALERRNGSAARGLTEPAVQSCQPAPAAGVDN